MDEPATFHQNISNYLKSITPSISQPIWIGLTDTEGVNAMSDYKWSVPSKQQLDPDQSQWGFDQPDSLTNLCVALVFNQDRSSLYWDDLGCQSQYQYLCQKGNCQHVNS